MTGIFLQRFLPTLVLIFIFGSFVGKGVVGIPAKSYAELLLSTSYGLDLSQVHLVVDAPLEYEDKLYERARAKLNQAGLYTKTKFANSYNQWEPLFRLTFEVEPVDESCSNLFLYTKKLEIVEQVNPERKPRIRAWAVTWGEGNSWPEVRKEKLTLTDLEKDLDELLRKFIVDYKYANKQ